MGEPGQEAEAPYLGEFVATDVYFCNMHWALPLAGTDERWCVHPDGNSRDCHFVQLFYQDAAGSEAP